MRRVFCAAVTLFAAFPLLAQAGETCATNFLSGAAESVIDAQTGEPIALLPYAAVGYGGVGPDYAVTLGGDAYGKPIAPPPPPPQPPTGGFMSDLTLQSNALGVTRLLFPGDGTARLTGPGTDFTFTGVDASALAFDGNLVARGGFGTLQGVMTTAVPIAGFGSDAVLSVSSGFAPGPRGVLAQFANGVRLEAFTQRL